MGREVITELTFQGHRATGKLLLEAQDVIVRGDLRATIPRNTITHFGVDGDDLVISTPNGDLRAFLGAATAAVWAKALAKPAPSLAQKLEVAEGLQTLVIGTLSDAALIKAMGSSAEKTRSADTPVQFLAEIFDMAGWENAIAAIAPYPLAAIWCVTIKGPTAPLPEAYLRQSMRALGYIDTKSCAVLPSMTATRYIKRRS